jgi:uncharacterized protein YbjT (DUF2867 family)
MEVKKNVVFGASGVVGSNLITLLKQKKLEYLAVYRKEGNTGEKNKDILEIFDVSEKDIAGANVFCCIGSSLKKAGSKEKFIEVELDLVVNLAEFCFALGCENFNIISSVNANSGSKIFYAKVKGDLEKKLLGIGFKKLNIVRPSLLDGKREEFRFLESLALLVFKPVGFLFVGPLLQFKPIDVMLVAKCMLHLALFGENKVNILENKDMHRMDKIGFMG